MTTPTTNFAFGKPVVGGDSDTWGTESNTIFDSIDTLLATGRWVAAGGAVDVITATYSPAVTTLIDGMLVGFRASAANLTTTPTFSPNGMTAHTITRIGGTALVAGDIPAANYEALLRYNLANTRWELLNPGSLDSGTYTPTISGSSNIATSTTYACQWSRNGKVVTVSGRMTLTPSVNATDTQANFTIPVAASFTAVNQAGGTAFDPASQCGAAIHAIASDTRVELQYKSTGIVAQDFFFLFSYLIP